MFKVSMRQEPHPHMRRVALHVGSRVWACTGLGALWAAPDGLIQSFENAKVG